MEGKRPGRNDPCWCGSGKKFKRCCIDKPLESVSPVEAYSPDGGLTSGHLTLVVETAAGAFVRTIDHASPLRRDVRPGTAAELATSDAAAVWGLPDFVYRAALRRSGSATRELGDGILLIGDVGVVVQVKCREELSGSPERERIWLEKKIREALRQANGTIRLLKKGPTTLTSRRDRTIVIDGRTVRWLAVAVLDHPEVEAGIVPDLAGANPSVALLRRDWEFLFRQLKATSAVVDYLERVAGESVDLGSESVRYYELALADETAPSNPLNPSIFGGRGRPLSAPRLRTAPIAHTEEREYLFLRAIFEDIALAGIRQTTEETRLRALVGLDRLHVSYRGETGRYLIEALENVAAAPKGTIDWRFRRIVADQGSTLLGFGACSQLTEQTRWAFTAWTQLRHHELLEELDSEDVTTFGVMVTPRRDGRRSWDTSMVVVAGDLGLTEAELEVFRDVWSGSQAA
jgi:hypothetical protein